jgi:hypothetical protein
VVLNSPGPADVGEEDGGPIGHALALQVGFESALAPADLAGQPIRDRGLAKDDGHLVLLGQSLRAQLPPRGFAQPGGQHRSLLEALHQADAKQKPLRRDDGILGQIAREIGRRRRLGKRGKEAAAPAHPQMPGGRPGTAARGRQALVHLMEVASLPAQIVDIPAAVGRGPLSREDHEAAPKTGQKVDQIVHVRITGVRHGGHPPLAHLRGAML